MKKIIWQQTYSSLIESEMNKYLSRPGAAFKQPSILVLAGFPGIGKSEIVNNVSDYLGIPIVRIGMQQFTSDDGDVASRFLMDVNDKIMTARRTSKTGKYILLIEEMDKIYEKNPQNGALVARPVMGPLKDLMADGKVDLQAVMGNNSRSVAVDIRDAYTFVTMNFGTDLFGFEADPRLTTAGDMLGAWERLSTRPADLKGTLSKLFLPETISRIMPYFNIMKPLSPSEYEELLDGVIEKVAQERFLDKKGKNLSQITLKLSANYKRYLLSETVIPSEGARYTVLASKSRILNDIEFALNHISKSSKYSAKPFELLLDFSPKTNTVTSKATVPSLKLAETIAKRKIQLTFPPPEALGLLDPVKALTSVHEFGHAYAAVRLGYRFEIISIIPPKTGTGGYVKFTQNNGMSARAMMADLYSALGSRSMERIFYSENPMDARSVMSITSGASSDIKGATEILYNMIYRFGFDPKGGTILRDGVPAQPFAKFADIPVDQIDGMGKILRNMEDLMVGDFLAAHDQAWYKDRILKVGQAGVMTEEQFYKNLGYDHPDISVGFLGDPETAYDKLAGLIQPRTPGEKAARTFKQGNTSTTAKDNVDYYLKKFSELIDAHLHGGGVCDDNLQAK